MLGTPTDPSDRNAFEELKLRGHRLYVEGQWELAANAYTEALQTSFALGSDVQTLSTILSNRSAAHARVGRWQHSLEDAEQAVLMHPGNLKAYYRKGVALLQLQRAAESVAALRLGVQLAPKNKQLAKCLVEAETCARNGFQFDRKPDTDTARQVRRQEMQSRQGGEAVVWTAGQQNRLLDVPGSDSQSHTPQPGWYRGTCSSDAREGAASRGDIAPAHLQTFLAILKVAADASPTTIRHAYLKRAMEEHPDKGGSAGAFAQVHAAYRALCMRAVP